MLPKVCHVVFDFFINDTSLLDMSCSIYNHAADNCISYSHNNVDCIKSVLGDEIISLIDFPISPIVPEKDSDIQIEINENAITVTSTL